MIRFKNYQYAYLVTAIIWIVYIILRRLLSGYDAIPYRFEEFLLFKGNILAPLITAWPLFTFGIFLNGFKMASTLNAPEIQRSAPALPAIGFMASLLAGLLEEITFRWVLLYAMMGVVHNLNSVVELITDTGYIQVWSQAWFGPFTLWFFSGAEEVLKNPATWTVVLAMLLSNHKFQQGHLYQGITGWIFSWFGGMMFFYVMFHHGLLAAMWAHFVFDWMIFLMLFVDVQLETRLGKNRMYAWYKTNASS